MLKEKIQENLKLALREQKELSLSVHRLLVTAISRQEQAGERRELSDDEIIKIVMSEAKKRKEAAKLYRDGNREEQAVKEEQELEILNNYLPPAPTEEEIKDIIANCSEKNPGLVIKEVMQKTGGRADIEIIKKHL